MNQFEASFSRNYEKKVTANWFSTGALDYMNWRLQLVITDTKSTKSKIFGQIHEIEKFWISSQKVKSLIN